MKDFSNRISQIEDSIFSVIAKKSQEVGAINLGQGFPDFETDQYLKDFAKEAIDSYPNQYAPMRGIPSLIQSVINYQKNCYGISYDKKEVLVSSGATEAIFSSIMAIVNPGDEVIIFEPFYDSYVASTKMAGGIPIPVTLKSPSFDINFDHLEESISSKTKLMIVNNPHNPSGKVFSKDELKKIADLAIKHDLFILSDEVYEFLTYGKAKHIPIATFAKERTITISSAGKTFGLTGWKIGWLVANEQIIKQVSKVHQFNVFSVSTPMQIAVAKALDSIDRYLENFRELYLYKRNFLFNALTECGFSPIMPEGSYFMLAGYEKFSENEDIKFCQELIEKHSVTTIPPSAFYISSNESRNMLRFCFAKREETLRKGAEMLKLSLNQDLQ